MTEEEWNLRVAELNKHQVSLRNLNPLRRRKHMTHGHYCRSYSHKPKCQNIGNQHRNKLTSVSV